MQTTSFSCRREGCSLGPENSIRRFVLGNCGQFIEACAPRDVFFV
jgi:hypothetical protein